MSSRTLHTRSGATSASVAAAKMPRTGRRRRRPRGRPSCRWITRSCEPAGPRTTSLRCCWRAGRVTRSRAEALYGFGRVVQAKGRSDATALLALNAWYQEAGLNGDIRLRTDGEPAIRAVARAAAIRRAPAVSLLETSPVGSSDSLGSCERFAETVAGMARTWRLAVEKNLEIEVSANSPIFSWLVRHVVFLYEQQVPTTRRWWHGVRAHPRAWVRLTDARVRYARGRAQDRRPGSR